MPYIRGWGISGSAVKGSKGLLFRTRKEAVSFAKKIGGKAVKKKKKY
jgi:hypothetical protein